MKDNKIIRNFQLKCKDKLLDVSKPLVMGILNVSPDSFYEGSRVLSEGTVLSNVRTMLEDGASILDVGGVSTRPGADPVSLEEELSRVIPAIKIIVNHYPDIILSVDTFRSEVAAQAVRAGASIVNDVSGGRLDPKMFETVSKLDVPYILMHSRGDSKNMQSLTDYLDVVQDVITELSSDLQKLRSYGVKDVIIDPGFGFAKTINQNFELLNCLRHFNVLDCPLLIGVSRKSMIYKHLKICPDEALNGTTVLNTIGILNGANIVRVHDVKEASQAIELVNPNFKISKM